MTITYRNNDPVSGRWTGIGSNLSAFEIDSNFYDCTSRITSLEGDISFTVSVAYITIAGNSLTFHMTDHTLQGPFAIPPQTFTDRGTWQPFTTYAVNDTFNINGTLYLVNRDHTSAATFSAGANDGAGHNYYSPMITTPGSALPTGGATGQVLSKSTSSDYAVTWSYKLPTGGSTGQLLTKQSGTNQDAAWATTTGVHAPPPSPAGSSGEALATADGGSVNTEWIKVAYAPSASGAAGQALATVDGTHTHTEWLSVVSAPPPSPAGAAGQVLSTVDGTNTNTAWINAGGSSNIDTIQFIIDGGGAVLTTGLKGYIEMPFNCTITQATLLADQSGSVVVDVYAASYASFDAVTHPAAGDKITASAPPTISSAVKSQDATLTGWSTFVAAGDILAFNVNSVTTIQRVTISLKVTK